MDYLPISLRVSGQPCLVVGGGDVAFRKASLLVRAGARVVVVAPEIDAAFDGLGSVECNRRSFAVHDLHGVWIAVAATDDAALNRLVSREAGQRGVPVNVVDDPDACTFVMPAIVDRTPLLVAISSAGASPILARKVRGDIEALLSPGLGALAALLGRKRAGLKRRFPGLADRRVFVERFLQGDFGEVANGAGPERLEGLFDRALTADLEGARTGRLFVVGVGPGDPDSLTFRAQRLMQQADRVYFECGLSERVVDRCRRDAHRVVLSAGDLQRTRWAGLGAAVEHLAGAERVVVLVAGNGASLYRSIRQDPQVGDWQVQWAPGLE